jgi:CRP-like cAMP-binding protein
MASSAFGAGVSASTTVALPAKEPKGLGREWVPVLEEVPLFQGLSRRHLRRIAALARTRRYPAGASIVRTGDPGNAFYVVLDGKARVVPPNRRSVTLRRGDSFGEMSLLDGAPRSADVVADEETLVLWIGQAGFAKLLRREPAIAHALLRQLAGRLRAAQRTQTH